MARKLFRLLVGLSLLIIAQTKPEKCLVIAFAGIYESIGGGTRGAYEAGVLKGFAEKLPVEERNWQVVTGISVGGINALGLSLFEAGDESSAAQFMWDLWKQMTREDIYVYWKYGIANGLIFQSGLFNSTPEHTFLQDIVDTFPKGLRRDLLIGVTDTNKGKFFNLHMNKLEQPMWSKYVMASSAIPGIFPFWEMNDTVLSDGSVIANLNLPDGIRKCEEMGYKHSDIVFDVLLCAHRKPIDADMSKSTTIPMFWRYYKLQQYVKSVFFLEEALRAFPDINWRYMMEPSKDLPEWPLVPLSFDPDDLMGMMNIGYDDAVNAVKNGPKSIKQIIEEGREAIMREYLAQLLF